MNDSQLTLQKKVDICKSSKSANKHVHSLAIKSGRLADINKMQNNKYKRQKVGINKNINGLKSEFKCKYCAEKHEFNRDNCPAFIKICKNVSKEAILSRFVKIENTLRNFKYKVLVSKINHMRSNRDNFLSF